MKQRKLHSLGEAVFNIFVSIGFAYALNITALPAFRHSRLTDSQIALLVTAMFTVVSLIRQYFIRRLFNWWHHKEEELKEKTR